MADSRGMSDAQLMQQLALLGWLKTDSEQCKEFLTSVTGMQVLREVLNRLSGQGKVDAYKMKIRPHVMTNKCRNLSNSKEFTNFFLHNLCILIHNVVSRKECILSIADYVKRNPRASQMELNAEVEKQVLLFASRVQALN